MFRIDDPTAATSLPVPEAAGTEGYYTEGNPVAGNPATNVRASWLNMIQEELRAVVIAAGLTPSKTTYTQVRDAIKSMFNAGRLVNVQVFRTNGTFTYTKTPGTLSAIVECQGAGGSGSGTPVTGASQCAVGGAGASGARAVAFFANGVPNGASIVVGLRGAAVNGGSNTGGTSSVGSLMTAPGGLGGSTAGPSAPPLITGGGSGATGAPTVSGATVVLSLNAGDSGDSGYALSTGTLALVGGRGASSPYGGGGPVRAGNTPGSAATGNGSGGSGAATSPSQATIAGGPGGDGIVIIYEFAG